MKIIRIIMAALLLVIGTCWLFYALERSGSGGSAPISRARKAVSYGVRKICFYSSYTGVATERGTLQQNTSGGWSLLYDVPKTDPYVHVPIQAIGFRVPAHLSATVAALKDKMVDVTIGKEPDPNDFVCTSFVLNSVAPVR